MGGGASKPGSLERARHSSDHAYKLFASLDVDNSGSLDVGELCEAMQKHGASIKADWTINEIKRVIKKYDIDNDKKLSSAEFASALGDMVDRDTTRRGKRKDVKRQWTWKKPGADQPTIPTPPAAASTEDPPKDETDEMSAEEVQYWMEQHQLSVAAKREAEAEADAKAKAKEAAEEAEAKAIAEAKEKEERAKLQAKMEEAQAALADRAAQRSQLEAEAQKAEAAAAAAKEAERARKASEWLEDQKAKRAAEEQARNAAEAASAAAEQQAAAARRAKAQADEMAAQRQAAMDEEARAERQKISQGLQGKLPQDVRIKATDERIFN